MAIFYSLPKDLRRNFRTGPSLTSSEEGRALVRQILQDPRPHTPHDDQIETVGKVLDGTDVLVLLPAGASKSAISVFSCSC